MRGIFANKYGFATVLFLFTMAFALNGLPHSAVPATASQWLADSEGHGPTMPPDPWAGLMVADSEGHGPTMPPDPWAGLTLADNEGHGPTMPPDPWAGLTLADSEGHDATRSLGRTGLTNFAPEA